MKRPSPHPFTPDPDLPPDQHGRHVCAACHLVGERGDAHHTMPVVPEQAEHLRRYGEGPDLHPFEPDHEQPKTCIRIDCRADISDPVHIPPQSFAISTQAVDREECAVD